MSANKYAIAPLSEVNLGVLFKGNILFHNGILFELINRLKSDFVVVQTTPTSPEENLENGQINQLLDYVNAGFSMYRLQSTNGNYILQLQQNYFSLSWKREDDESVGRYPGYDAVFGKFLGILEMVRELIGALKTSSSFESLCKSFILTYQDRLDVSETMNKGESLEHVLNIKLPSVVTTEGEIIAAGAIQSKFAMPIPKLNGYSVVTILTEAIVPEEKKLIVDFKLKGMSEQLEDWFVEAHKIQIAFFEGIFSKKLLKNWTVSSEININK